MNIISSEEGMLMICYEIGEAVKNNEGLRIECAERGDLSCESCCFYDNFCGKPTPCGTLACESGERPDGKDVIFLRLDTQEGGKQ